MKIISKLFNLYHKFSAAFHRKKTYKFFYKRIKLSIGNYKTKHLTKEQKKEIRNYWKSKIGFSPKPYWHELYYSLNNNFSVKYIPEDLYYGVMTKKLFDSYLVGAYDDKNIYDRLFPNTNMPKTILKVQDNHYYYNDQMVDKSEAIAVCANLPDAIIKPSYLSAGGDRVRRIAIQNGIDKQTNESIESIISAYGSNFIVQETIQQHPILAKLNSSSINTIRAVTYIRNTTVELLYSVMRIGHEGASLDNLSSGGYACKINDDGTLGENAFTFHPVSICPLTKVNHIGTFFCGWGGVQIPMYKQLVETAKRLHKMMPRLMIIGWDFTINDCNEVVFIEMNAPSETTFQAVVGPAFGQYTDEILDKCR